MWPAERQLPRYGRSEDTCGANWAMWRAQSRILPRRKGTVLAADQRRDLQAALVEAQAAVSQHDLDRIQADLAIGEFVRAAEGAGLVLAAHPTSEPAMRMRVEALTGAGRKRDALAEADQFVKRALRNPLLRAQRGFLRQEFDDSRGAAEDFSAAMAESGLTPEQRQNLQVGLAEIGAAEAQGELETAEAALKRGDYNAALEASRQALDHNPSSNTAIRIHIEALSRLGRKQDALRQADTFLSQHEADAVLRSQRGFIRRELRELAGAIEDFKSALGGDGLSADQRKNVSAALVEAQQAERQGDYDRAQSALARGDLKAASEIAAGILQREPNSDAARRIRIDALSRSGRKRELQADIDVLIAQGHASGWMYAGRGFSRADAGNLQGAVQDFDAALRRGGFGRKAISNIRYARAAAMATLAERAGRPQDAEAIYRKVLQSYPEQADAWYKLGYLLLKQKQLGQGADALNKGLEIRPVGAAYLDAANAYILMNAPLASKFYRQGLDRWHEAIPALRPGLRKISRVSGTRLSRRTPRSGRVSS